MVVSLALPAEAKTIRDIFASEPDNIFMILPSRTRMDMLDYYDSGNKVAASNSLSNDDTTSQLINVTDDYISISLTDATEITMRLLPLSANDSIVAVVKTSLLPMRDSKIAFYDTDWKEINKQKFFTTPSVKDFIKPNTSKAKTEEILSIVKFPIISYDLSTAEPCTITARLNLEQFLSSEDWNAIKDFLLSSITYTLQGKKFKKVKP